MNTQHRLKTSSLLNRHILAVMENEWAQLIRNRVVVFTTLGPTFLLVALAVSVLALTSFLQLDNEEINRAGASLAPALGDAASIFKGADAIRARLIDPFLVLCQSFCL